MKVPGVSHPRPPPQEGRPSQGHNACGEGRRQALLQPLPTQRPRHGPRRLLLVQGMCGSSMRGHGVLGRRIPPPPAHEPTRPVHMAGCSSSLRPGLRVQAPSSPSTNKQESLTWRHRLLPLPERKPPGRERQGHRHPQASGMGVAGKHLCPRAPPAPSQAQPGHHGGPGRTTHVPEQHREQHVRGTVAAMTTSTATQRWRAREPGREARGQTAFQEQSGFSKYQSLKQTRGQQATHGAQG